MARPLQPREFVTGLLGAVALLTACQDPPAPPEYLLDPDVAHVRVDTASLPRVELVHVRDVGELEGPNALARLSAATMLADGRLAVVDESSCTIVLIPTDAPTPDTLPRIGRCGDGPGEFRRIRALSSLGDTLAILPLSNPTLLLWTSDGEELARVALTQIVGDVIYASAAILLDGHRVVLASDLPPGDCPRQRRTPRRTRPST